MAARWAAPADWLAPCRPQRPGPGARCSASARRQMTVQSARCPAGDCDRRQDPGSPSRAAGRRPRRRPPRGVDAARAREGSRTVGLGALGVAEMARTGGPPSRAGSWSALCTDAPPGPPRSASSSLSTANEHQRHDGLPLGGRVAARCRPACGATHRDQARVLARIGVTRPGACAWPAPPSRTGCPAPIRARRASGERRSPRRAARRQPAPGESVHDPGDCPGPGARQRAQAFAARTPVISPRRG